MDVESREVWKDIDFIQEKDGSCAYQVSNMGRVKRAKEVVSDVDVKGLGVAGFTGKYARKLKPKILRTTNVMRKRYQGFTTVSIKDKTYPVHKLVARVFLSDTYRPDLTVNHKDGNRFNNRVENLEWVTQSENELHSYRVLGKRVWNKGTKGLMPKHWTPERKAVYDKRNKEIIRDKESGLTVKQLSEKYHLGDRVIYQILQAGVSNE